MNFWRAGCQTARMNWRSELVAGESIGIKNLVQDSYVSLSEGISEVQMR